MDESWELRDEENRKDLWLLVQTSNSLNNIIYSIIHNTRTIMMFDNQYPSVVTYLKLHDKIHQGIILKKSTNFSVLHTALIALAQHGLALGYPISPYDENDIEINNTPAIENIQNVQDVQDMQGVQDVEPSDNVAKQEN